VEGASPGLDVELAQSSWTVSDGGRVDLAVTADVSGLTDGSWYFATVVLTSDDPLTPSVRLPVAVRPMPTKGAYDDDLITRRDVSAASLDGLRARDGAAVTSSSLVSGVSTPRTLTTPTGEAHYVTVPAGTTAL